LAETQFIKTQVHDGRPAIEQENAIQRCLAFAGIHDTSFEDLIWEQHAGTLSDSYEGSEGTWAYSGGVLQGTGNGSAQWYKIRHVTDVEPGFVVTFDKTSDRGGFLFNCDDSYNCHMVWWQSNCVGLSLLAGSTGSTLLSLPIAETGAATVKIAVWPRSYSSVDEIDDLAVMLWFDDRHLFTHMMPYVYYGDAIGLAVYESDTATFDNLRVPQLHHIVEWTSVDPGEPVSSGVSRVIGYEDIKMRARYDGTVHVWRETGSAVDWAMSNDRCLTQNTEENLFWPSHYRLVGAMHEADGFRPGNQGHIFAVGQDPNALSASETYDKAERKHEKIEEAARVTSVATAPNPTLEPEDVVTLDGETWRVVSINYRAIQKGDVRRPIAVLESTIQMRECL